MHKLQEKEVQNIPDADTMNQNNILNPGMWKFWPTRERYNAN
jgi:hypothetical protein